MPAPKLKALPPKKCVVCGETFAREGTDTYSHFKARATCQTSCARKLSWEIRRRKRKCAVCHETFMLDEGERKSSKRKTCSQECRTQLHIMNSVCRAPIAVYKLPAEILRDNLAQAERAYAQYARQGFTYGANQ